MKPNPYDLWHMKAALNLARTGLGRVWPNPSVGCVIVKDGHVVGRARTADSGRPHAETIALAMAGANAKGAHAYVTLEPCAHHGQTGPCAQALIDAGITKVIIATEDTDIRVKGRGADMLRHAGIDVVVGILEDKARDLNQGFFLRHTKTRPLISLKTATTLDAKIATSTGQSKWITSGLARRRGHLLRAQHDAIIVGINTVLSDNPSLTTRIGGLAHHGVRIVFDSNLRLRGTEKIFDDVANAPIWVITTIDSTQGSFNDRARPLINAGADIITVPKNADGQIDLKAAMQALSTRGLTRVLVEGGATLMSAFLRARLYDTLYWFRAGSVIGADGLNAAQALGIDTIDKKINLTHAEQIILGEDRLDIYTQ